MTVLVCLTVPKGDLVAAMTHAVSNQICAPPAFKRKQCTTLNLLTCHPPKLLFLFYTGGDHGCMKLGTGRAIATALRQWFIPDDRHANAEDVAFVRSLFSCI